ncbi:class I SAM-dependent methyltransferase [Leptothrix discophora]|uniref:SAM-dependent methyltransferase n=1 Tax=Leptothrix discophora TaxID=89 RepID=A0ABT9G7G9_LEPDI|nr:SAM-dependent methyltransferase [Leptothrix discophora]MDP4302423.1 SAM-dependent methyltransferase [Leptothrix discophora]
MSPNNPPRMPPHNPAGSVASPPQPQPASGLSAPSPDSTALLQRIAAVIEDEGGWIGFERYMALALYSPGLGYYSRGDRQFGALPESGSDFITAPELSRLYGRALARQVAQALRALPEGMPREVWEFGAGSGALAAQLLAGLADEGVPVERYSIVDLSGTLRERQRQTLAERVPAQAAQVRWLAQLPEAFDGVVVGNELLDAMPVVLLHFDGHGWFERGVALRPGSVSAGAPQLVWSDRPTGLRPPVDDVPWPPGCVIELPRQAEAWVRTLAGSLRCGAAFLVDYGFPAHEFYHPQRHAGTLVCHRGHRVDDQPLDAPGDKDITAHVDFTAIALAAQDAGMDVLGYTSQARFLINCGLVGDLAEADLRERAAAQKLITEHEMGELFKVLALASAGLPLDPIGFAVGDRSHTL